MQHRAEVWYHHQCSCSCSCHERWKRAPDASGEWEGKRTSGTRFTVRRTGKEQLRLKNEPPFVARGACFGDSVSDDLLDGMRCTEGKLTARSWYYFTSLDLTEPRRSGTITRPAGTPAVRNSVRKSRYFANSRSSLKKVWHQRTTNESPSFFLGKFASRHSAHTWCVIEAER